MNQYRNITRMDLGQKIEAVLFYKNEGISKVELGRILRVSPVAINEAIEKLENTLQGRGVRLSQKDEEVRLVTAPSASTLIESIAKEELSQELGRAGLEVLAIIFYRGPISRSEVDYIRGVNSTFTLRNLMIRGLADRVPNPKDNRSFLYKPTFEAMNHLGITKLEDLPEYERVINELRKAPQSDESF